MILATHNSLTYLEPKYKWMKLFKFCYQCQDRPIYKQLNAGVKYFDFRISFDVWGNVEIRHKLIAFDCDYSQLMDIFALMNHKKDIVVRMVLERNKYSEDEDNFINLCSRVEHTFKNITFCCGEDVHSKKVIYKFNNTTKRVYECYSSVIGSKLNGLWPKRFAKKYNKEYYDTHKNDDAYLMLDFYEIQ